MSQYDQIIENQINGSNYGISTQKIVEKLKFWDAQYGINILDVTNDSILLEFKSLPDDLDPLAAEIYDFCPDIIDQNFGCMDEMVEMMEASGRELPQEIAELIEEIDFDDEDFGRQLLKKSLLQSRQISLWWD